MILLFLCFFFFFCIFLMDFFNIILNSVFIEFISCIINFVIKLLEYIDKKLYKIKKIL